MNISSFLVGPKRVEHLLGKSQSVNTLLKHQSKSSQVIHSVKDFSIKTSIVEWRQLEQEWYVITVQKSSFLWVSVINWKSAAFISLSCFLMLLSDSLANNKLSVNCFLSFTDSKMSLTVSLNSVLQGGPKKLRQIFLAITLVNMDRF